jgi:hypothetical protein
MEGRNGHPRISLKQAERIRRGWEPIPAEKLLALSVLS